MISLDKTTTQLIIDSLSSIIALIDKSGKILFVNESWKRFGKENGLLLNNHGIGLNYIDVTKSSEGTWSEEANAVVNGLNELISGKTKDFQIEYPCNSPSKRRWFTLKAKKISDIDNEYYLLLHEDITKSKEAELEIKEHRENLEEQILRRTNEIETLNSFIHEVNASLDIDNVIEKALEGLGSLVNVDTILFYIREKDKLILKKVVPERHLPFHYDSPIHQVGECLCGISVSSRKPLYSKNIYKDPVCTWHECKQAGYTSFVSLPLISGDDIIGVLGLASYKERNFEENASFLEAITGEISSGLQKAILYKKAKDGADQLKSNNEFLRVINEMLAISLQSDSLEEQLQGTLDLILSVPWLSIQKKGAIFLTKKGSSELYMVAERNLSEKQKATCKVVQPGQCLCGKALERQEVVFSNQIDENHSIRYEGMEEHGHYCIPISSSDKPLGVINIYVKEKHDEDIKEKNFLLAVANTLAGIIERKYVEDELLTAYKVFENAIEGVVVTNQDAVIEYVNPAFTEITGYSEDEVLGKKPNILRSDRHEKEFYKKMWESLLSTGQWNGEIWNRHKNGYAYPERLSITAIKNHLGETIQYAAVFTDITEIKQSQEKIEFQAYHDALTELPNRNLFYDRLVQAISNAKREKQKIALLFLDIDNFKHINDSLGHINGDKLLQDVSSRLKKTIREGDTVARLGGDEFVIILYNVEEDEYPILAADRIIETIKKPVSLTDQEINITTSIGITIYPDDGLTAETLVKNADMAMYKAKEKGKNTFQMFTQEMNDKAIKRLEITSNLKSALENKELQPYYQPQVELSTGKVTGVEALIRWIKPDGTIISPMDFIPIAEESGMINSIGEFVLMESVDFLYGLHNDGFNDLTISVNVSAKQFEDKNFLINLENILKSRKLDKCFLELEITESLIMKDIELAVRVMHELKGLGIKIHMDDFGTGYSSLSYLKNFPINKIKIDRSFIKDLTTDNDAATLTKAVLSISKSLGLESIAEGVETREQLDFLREHGCDYVQGYYYSPPIPEDELMKYLKRR